MIPSGADDRDVLAGEYVLGLLDADLAREFQDALASDADLRGRVTFWEERLLPLSASLRPVPAGPELWAGIERTLAGRSSKETLRRGGKAGGPIASAWRRTALWRATTALATAAAIALALLPPRSDADREAATRFFALLQSRDPAGAETGPGWLIQVTADGTVRSVPLANVEPGPGRSLQLWTLWDQARGPVSLGVLPPGGSIRLPPERLDVIGSGQLFEITLEPEAGSPTGRPTGRILFIGRASAPATRAL